jgi:hypothetical protein
MFRDVGPPVKGVRGDPIRPIATDCNFPCVK